MRRERDYTDQGRERERENGKVWREIDMLVRAADFEATSRNMKINKMKSEKEEEGKKERKNEREKANLKKT